MKAFEELKETTKKDIIIDGIMRSKGVYLLVSKPKVGKSLFALQLANSIANNKAFLDHEILKPSPVLYITTELSDSQLKDRCNLLGISFEKNKFFVIDRDEKQNINFMDIEYQVKEFAEELNGRILILDMLKGIDFNISYDINSYQDISQKLMPKIRSYADKYNLTILFVHHLNKLGKTLGSTGFDVVVDGIIRLSKNNLSDRYKTDIQKLIKTVCNFAEKQWDFNLRKFYNKLEPFKTPGAVKKEMEVYKPDEFFKFISVVNDIQMRCLYKSLYYCGLRRGEARGLQWKNVDLDNRRIYIKQQVQNNVETNNDKDWYICACKTNTSHRVVPIPEDLYEELTEFKRQLKKYKTY